MLFLFFSHAKLLNLFLKSHVFCLKNTQQAVLICSDGLFSLILPLEINRTYQKDEENNSFSHDARAVVDGQCTDGKET